MTRIWTQIFLLCTVLSACYTDTSIVNVHCQNGLTDGCHIKGKLNIHNDAILLNFIDADAWNQTTYLQIPSESSVTIMPTGIFQRFKKLAEIQILADLQTLESSNFKDANKLTILDLTDNQLKLIPGNIFAEANQLEEITLSNNQINTIDDFAFNGLDKLQYIYLSNNLLTVLRVNTFAGAEDLRGLTLDNNNIETIEDGALNLPKLKSLFLSYNRLRHLSDNVFSGAPNLFGITMASNKLETIGQSFYSLRKLSSLILDANRIQDIDLSAFARLPELYQISLRESGFRFNKIIERAPVRSSKVIYLDLSKNELSESDVLQRLAIFGRMEELKMEENNFSVIDGVDRVKRIFPNLIRLALSGNRLTCEQIQTIVQSLRTQHVVVGAVDNFDILDGRKNFKGIICL